MHLTLKTPPAFEPITLEDIKAQAVVGHDADDHLLVGIIEQARDQVESDTQRALVEQTWQLKGACFTDEIIVPRPPLVSVTHIKYVDTDGVQQTLPLADYQIVTTNVCARIKPAPGTSWPATQAGNEQAVEIEFVAGYVTDDGNGGYTGTLPPRAKTALLIWAAHLYENREHLSPVQQHELPSYKSAISTLEIYSL